MIGDAYTLAAQAAADSRKSASRVLSGDTMRELTRRADTVELLEQTALDSIRSHRDDPNVTIVWRAHTGQPTGHTERHTWYPGTPLPHHTLYITCTVTAPLQD
jgi:hypothetical protein